MQPATKTARRADFSTRELKRKAKGWVCVMWFKVENKRSSAGQKFAVRCKSEIAGSAIVEERPAKGVNAARKTAEILATSLNVTATVYGTDADGEFVYGVFEVADGAAAALLTQKLGDLPGWMWLSELSDLGSADRGIVVPSMRPSKVALNVDGELQVIRPRTVLRAGRPNTSTLSPASRRQSRSRPRSRHSAAAGGA
jgi:hypothetical protein